MASETAEARGALAGATMAGGGEVQREQEQDPSSMDERVLFTPLCGAHNEDPLAYLLQIDDTRILLDCGWNDNFDPAMLEPLRAVVPTVNLVLVSFADLEHMGALPYVLKEFKMNESAVIYMTRATKQLGVQFLYDAYISRAREKPFDLFDLDDVDRMESRIKDIGYEFPITVRGKSVSPIEIDALAAGRILGGAMWRIRREPDVILYAVDFNHARDSHLDGMFSKIDRLKPTLMITDAYNFRRSTRDVNRRRDDLWRKVLAVLRRNRNVLMPVDSGGRLLELLYVLDSYFTKNKLTYPIVLVTSVPSVLGYARTNIEYMHKDIGAEFEKTRRNPFELSHVQVVASVEQVHSIRDPKVVLASSSSLESGAARELLARYGSTEGHMVLLTDRSMVPGSLARQFVDHLQSQRTDHLQVANLRFELKTSRWEYKTGQELVRWRMEQRERVQAEMRRKHREEEAKALRDDMAMDGMEEDLDIDRMIEVEGGRAGGPADDDAPVGTDYPGARGTGLANGDGAGPNAGPGTLARQQSLQMAGDDAARTGGGLFAVFASSSTDASRSMFSAYEPERTKRWDEYGEVIRDEDYMIGGGGTGGLEGGGAEGKDGVDGSGLDEDDDDLEDDFEDEAEDAAGETSGAATGEDGGPEGALVPTGEDGAAEPVRKRRKRRREMGNTLMDAILPRERRQNLPRTCVTEDVPLYLRCSLAYVDMEGRASGLDIMHVIGLLKPTGLRKVVVVHGTEEDTKAMVQRCLDSAIQTAVGPVVSETVDVSSDVGMWRVELDRGLFDPTYPLFSAPRALTIGDSKRARRNRAATSAGPTRIGIRYVEGVVEPLDETSGVDGGAGASAVAALHAGRGRMPVIRPLAEPKARYEEPQFIFTSVSKYEVFKKLQQFEDELQPRMVDNYIVCKDAVTVLLENGGQQVLVEGPVSATYFRVRDVVYGSYIQV
ncbi:Cleavage and polyadenylation specificity factor subunit 2 [Hondaea fermentalgiana]|uniref:Cleavage and polyadenylation specificity factor subunit 2 n=1 Tax=Hondaea fermentalgiana TaxID=2315210 RepID=A0A2R5GBP7_9STRA|nr:Cleavage and polyadenylation specificity factor subunit 2 [Hondaea fermentalgiana]|eukprot:GBG26003.1 Cleavage and polyadenylation specificity factor subunit 2 [Hondaea fermentalgiana]